MSPWQSGELSSTMLRYPISPVAALTWVIAHNWHDNMKVTFSSHQFPRKRIWCPMFPRTHLTLPVQFISIIPRWDISHTCNRTMMMMPWSCWAKAMTDLLHSTAQSCGIICHWCGSEDSTVHWVVGIWKHTLIPQIYCEDLLFFSVSCDNKLNIFWFLIGGLVWPQPI